MPDMHATALLRERRKLSSCRPGVFLFVSLALAMAVGVAFPTSAFAEDEAEAANQDIASQPAQTISANESDDVDSQTDPDATSDDASDTEQLQPTAEQDQADAGDAPQVTPVDSEDEDTNTQPSPDDPQEGGEVGDDPNQSDDGSQEQEAAPVLPTHQFSLESGLSYGMVADAKGGACTNGTNVQLYRSNGTSAQRWTLEAYGKAYYIVNKASGKVLDVAGGKAVKGTNVQLYEKNGTNAQLWLPKAVSNGGVVLCSMLGEDLVLDVSGARKTNGANLQVWIENGTAAQSFWFREVNPAMEAGECILEDGAYVLTLAKGESTRMVLDVAGGKTTSGANIQLYRSNGTNAQRFYASYANGYYTFQSCASGLALDVAGSCPVAGTNVRLYTPNHSAGQQWKIEERQNGFVCLTNRGTGLVLDISGGKTSNGANAQGYYSNGSLAQLWKLTRTGIVADGCYTIMDCASGKVLDVSGGSLANGARVQRYAANGTYAQKFFLARTDAGYDRYTIRSVNSVKGISGSGNTVIQTSGPAAEWTLVMTDSGLRLSNGGLFLGFDSNGKACLTTAARASSMRVTTAKLLQDGFYQLRLTNNQALDVSGQSTSASDVTLAASGSSLTQVWRLICVSGNTYKLINAKSGLYLAVSSANRAGQMKGADTTNQWIVSWDARNGGIVFTNVAKKVELSFAEADGLVVAGTSTSSATQKGRWFLVNKRLAVMQDHIAQVAEHFASHSAHGYSQPNRGAGGTEVIYMADGMSVTISKADVDCSEMARQCVNAVLGYNAIGYMDTRCEDRLLTAKGLVKIAFSADVVQRGDVLWRQGHTAIALGDGKQAEAYCDEYGSIYGSHRGDNTGSEVAVNTLRTSGYWTYIYRYV